MDGVHATPDVRQPELAAPAAGSRPRPARTHALRTVLIDMVAPVAVYYCTRAAGGSIWLALASSAIVPAVSVLAGVIGRRRIDAMGITILAALAVSSAFSAVTGSPRVLLARDGLLTAAWAGYMYLSLLARRPATFVVSRPLLEGRRVYDARAPCLGPACRPDMGRAVGTAAAIPADLAGVHRHLGHRDPC